MTEVNVQAALQARPEALIVVFTNGIVNRFNGPGLRSSGPSDAINQVGRPRRFDEQRRIAWLLFVAVDD